MSSMEKRFKDYEGIAGSTLPRRAYTIVRVDGRAFHTYTQRLARPFSRPLATALDAAAKALCEEISGSLFAYVQSDEISVLFSDRIGEGTQPWFGGDVQKITSVTASLVTGVFNREMHDMHIDGLAQFDSRVFTVPDSAEAVNYFIWRQHDAMRNSVMMLARHHMSHKALHGLHSTDVRQALKDQHGVDWAVQPKRFRQGGEVFKESAMLPITYTDKRTGEEMHTEAFRSWWENHAAGAFTYGSLALKLFPPIGLAQLAETNQAST